MSCCLPLIQKFQRTQRTQKSREESSYFLYDDLDNFDDIESDDVLEFDPDKVEELVRSGGELRGNAGELRGNKEKLHEDYCSETQYVPPSLPLAMIRESKDIYAELSRERVLACVRALVAQEGVRYVAYRYGTVFVCPASVEDPPRTARKLLKSIDVMSAHYVPQQADEDLKVFVFGQLEGFRGALVIVNPLPLYMREVPHQHLIDVARMFLLWDREDQVVTSTGIINETTTSM